MKKLTKILAAIAVAALIGPVVADAIGPDSDGRTPTNVYLQAPDGGTVRAKGTSTGETLVSGSVTMQGTTPDGGTATIRLDSDRRQVVAVGGVSGACLGADLTTASGSGPTLAAGTEYRVCALTDLWISWAGGTAAADAPSEPLFARTCVVRGPFAAQTTPTAVLPAGASALAGKELVACPVTRPQ